MLASLLILQLASAQPQEQGIPIGWLEHCGRTQEVGCRLSEPVSVEDVFWTNVAVNYAIKYRPEAEEAWRVFPEDRKGDCDDYAMSKRAYLLSLGLPPSDAEIVIGEVMAEGSWVRHVVLEVKVEGKKLVLDNMVPDKIYPPEWSDRPKWRELMRRRSDSAMWR